MARTYSSRVGGGYEYMTDEPQLGLERLFEHKSALPWTAHSCDTVASGPKVTAAGAVAAPPCDVFLQDQRVPKFPPRMELAPLPPVVRDMPPALSSERRPPRPQSARAAIGGGGGMLPRGGGGSGALPAPAAGQGDGAPAGAAIASCEKPRRPRGPNSAGTCRPGSRSRAASGDRAAGEARTRAVSPFGSASRATAAAPAKPTQAKAKRKGTSTKTPPPTNEAWSATPSSPHSPEAATAVGGGAAFAGQNLIAAGAVTSASAIDETGAFPPGAMKRNWSF